MIDKATLDAAEAVLAAHGMETMVQTIFLHNDDERGVYARAERLAARDDCGGGWWWRVTDTFGSAMNHDGEWEFEPSPSNRTEPFFARCRFRDFAEALAVFVANKERLVR